MPDETMISASTAARRRRYGLNRATIRRVSRSRVGSISGGGFLSGPPPRRSERMAPEPPAPIDAANP